MLHRLDRFSWVPILIVFLAFGLNHLGEFLNRDEPVWLYERIPKYYNAWANWDLDRTYVNDKPGILPAILAGIVNIFSPYTEYDYHNFHRHLFWWRLPILIFNGAMVVVIFFLLRKLLDSRAAGLITATLCFTPQLIAYSQMVNPDSTAWTTAFAAFLSFLVYLKSLKPKFVWITAVFFGLALISKFNTTILFPTFFLVLYLSYLFGSLNRIEFVSGFKQLMIIYSVAVGIYILFIPAGLTDPDIVLGTTLSAPGMRSIWPLLLFVMIFSLVESTTFKGRISNFLIRMPLLKILRRVVGGYFLLMILGLLINLILGSPFFDFHQYFLTYQFEGNYFPPTLVASHLANMVLVTPPILLGFLFLSVFMVFGESADQSSSGPVLFAMIVIMAFFVGSSISGFYVNARYQVIMLPFITFAVGVFLSRWKKAYPVVLLVLVGSNLWAVNRVSPFYYNYQNSLGFYSKPIWSTYGYGGFEIAHLLNQLPDAGHVNVGVDLGGYYVQEEFVPDRSYAWKERSGFHPFFKGNVSPYIRSLQEPIPDYLILTPRGDRFYEEMRTQDSKHIRESYVAGMDLPSIKNIFLKYRNLKPAGSFQLVDTPPLELRVVKVNPGDFKSFKNHKPFDTGLSLDLSQSFSISFWIEANNATPGSPISFEDSTENEISLKSEVWNRFGVYRLVYRIGDSTKEITTRYIHDGGWHHLALRHEVSRDSILFGIYVDGLLTDTKSLPAPPKWSSKLILNQIDGAADDIRIYDFALSQAQITEVYKRKALDYRHILETTTGIFRPVRHYRAVLDEFRPLSDSE